MNSRANRKNQVSGVLYSIAAFAVWGILPLYWKALDRIPAAEILAHRIFWSFVFAVFLMLIYGRWKELKNLMAVRANRFYVYLSAGLLSANWYIYIWAVNASHVVEASLGYYINPLLSVALGITVLREKLNFWQIVSFILAFAGVAYTTVNYGRVPWIALCLALTFGIYGLVKKLSNFDSTIGLALETGIIAPVALGYLVFKHANMAGSFGVVSFSDTLLLIFSGVVTSTPLLWFAKGAQRISLSAVGFIQYLAPTISLSLGVFIFHEPFTRAEGLSFGLIWAALLIYSLSGTALLKQMQPNYFRKVIDENLQ